MGADEVTEKLLDMLEEICGDPVVREEPDIDLFAEGLLDSMAAIELLVDIEDVFGVSIGTTEYKREEMNTPALIALRVKEHLA